METRDELSTTCNLKVMSRCLSAPHATSIHHYLQNHDQYFTIISEVTHWTLKVGSQSTMAFRFVRFVSLSFVSLVFVPSATEFPGSQSTITHLDDVYDKMGRKRLKKLLFLAVLYRRRRKRLCTSNRRFWVIKSYQKA